MTIKQIGGVFGRHPSFSSVEVDGLAKLGSLSVSGASTLASTTATTFTASSLSNFGALTYPNSGMVNIKSRSSNSTAIYIEGYDDAEAWSVGVNVNGDMTFSDSGVERLQFADQTGDLKVLTGNLVIGTSGKGIDFSATSGTGTSELFDDYEEGTWTPTFSAEFTTAPTVTSAQYTKIGRQVTVTMLATDGVVTAGGSIGGLPFASNASQGAGAYGGNSDTTESMQGTVGQSASSITNIPARTLTGDTWQITATYFTT